MILKIKRNLDQIFGHNFITGKEFSKIKFHIRNVF